MNFYSIHDLHIGTKEEFKVCITEEMQNIFTQFTGDINPIHLDDKYAKKNRFESKIVYGMLTASFYSTLVGVYLPGEKCLLHECNMVWKKPVYIGDELIIKGEVKAIDERFNRVHVRASIINQKGEKVSRATLVVGVR